jgi:hypothetical protein
VFQVLDHYPDGLDIFDFEQAFREVHGCNSLDLLKQIGITAQLQVVNHFPDDIKYLHDESTGHYVLFKTEHLDAREARMRSDIVERVAGLEVDASVQAGDSGAAQVEAPSESSSPEEEIEYSTIYHHLDWGDLTVEAEPAFNQLVTIEHYDDPSSFYVVRLENKEMADVLSTEMTWVFLFYLSYFVKLSICFKSAMFELFFYFQLSPEL